MNSEVRWDREEIQRVLCHLVRSYEQANSSEYVSVKDRARRKKKMPRRFVLFGKRLPVLGGDSELLRDAVRTARQTLQDSGWWPTEED